MYARREPSVWHGTAMKLDGIHHVTCITGDAPQNVEFYARHARAADGEEDRQPGRPDRLPPLLRRRARLGRRRHHVLRVSRAPARAAPATEWCTGSSFRVASEEALDFWGPRVGGDADATARCVFDDPEGLALELGVDDSGDEPLVADASRDPRRARAARLRRRPRVRVATAGERAVPRGARVRAGLGARAASTAAASTSTTSRRLSRPQGGAGTVHHVAWAAPTEEHAAWVKRVTDGRGAADARDRPLLVQVDLLPRAERRAVRDRDARPGLHGRRAARDARREAAPAADVRAPARRDRAEADAAAESRASSS